MPIRPPIYYKGETLSKDSLAGILHGFLGLLMIKVTSHISVGTPTDFCQDVARLTDEHGISTVVFPWDAGTTHLSTQLTRVERLMESTQSQVSGFAPLYVVYGPAGRFLKRGSGRRVVLSGSRLAPLIVSCGL